MLPGLMLLRTVGPLLMMLSLLLLLRTTGSLLVLTVVMLGPSMPWV